MPNKTKGAKNHADNNNFNLSCRMGADFLPAIQVGENRAQASPVDIPVWIPARLPRGRHRRIQEHKVCHGIKIGGTKKLAF
jgi:hypothetical protein